MMNGNDGWMTGWGMHGYGGGGLFLLVAIIVGFVFLAVRGRSS
ncbi:MAG: hypothetical protein ABL904_13440 [Hyphomicrobiaceae bacterium]